MKSLAERFWAKVNKIEGGCWEWTAYKMRQGYGVLILGSRTDGSRRTELAHRVSYTLAYGDFPEDQVICHSCDNPACVRPQHLFIGSQADNMLDMREKGRSTKGRPSHLRGTAHPLSKLTESEVVEIRRRYASGGVSLATLGKEFGVCPQTVHYIIKRRLWPQVA